MDADSYEPRYPRCRRAWERLGLKARRWRFEVASKRRDVIEDVTACVRVGRAHRLAVALRRADPNVGVEVIVSHVGEHHGVQLSKAGLSRPRGVRGEPAAPERSDWSSAA